MAKKTTTQIWIEYAAVRAVLGALSLLPLRTAMWTGMTAGSLAFHALGKLRRVGNINLELAFPEKSDAERTGILKRAFRNLGRVMAVVSHFGSLDASNMRGLIEYRPQDEFAAAYERTKVNGRGRIILGGHLGNWELQAFSYPVFFEPLAFLARRMDNPRIERLVLSIRTRLGNRQIDKTNSAVPILRALRSGGTVGILADVNSHPKEGVFVPFFGIPACTATGIAMLAIRANAVIVPMFAMWNEEEKRYSTVHGAMIHPPESGDRRKDIEEITARCVSETEKVIRQFPDQWIWIHRRWKTRPPGEPELY
ncbi:MAG: lysophospholipid acyltransferase family protein [Pyrinomonadaceae bacterium]